VGLRRRPLRLIAASARLGRSLTDLRGAVPDTFATPEVRRPVDDAHKFALVEAVRHRLEAEGAQVTAIDGVRVTTPDGWWLLRASNTEPAVVTRAESASAEGLARLEAEIEQYLHG